MTETDFLKREAGSGRMMGFQSRPSLSRIMGMGMDMDTRQRSASRKPLLMDGSDDRMYSLRVVQQPERARLCSFKEENETSESPRPVVKLDLY